MKERIVKKMKRMFRISRSVLWRTTTFVALLMLYLLGKIVRWTIYFLENHTAGIGNRFLESKPIVAIDSRVFSLYMKFINYLNIHKQGTISRIELIELSLRNMRAKGTRTLVTIGGMAIGIGAIVFLVSLGYGVERLVITRVASLDELRQADVTPQAGGKVKINDKTIADFKSLSNVKMVLPLIAVVGRVNYNNSVSDMAVYGVTSDYLKQSAIKPIAGKLFESNDLAYTLPPDSGQVAGVSTEVKYGVYGEKIQDVDYSIDPGTWVRVREGPSTSSKIIGYTKRVEGTPQGQEVWGSTYISDDQAGSAGETENGATLGKWVKTQILLWKNQKCDPKTEGDCENGQFMVMRGNDNQQVSQTGYFAELGMTVTGFHVTSSNVLGVSTSADSSASGAGTIDWVEIASEAGIVKPPEAKTVKLGASAKKQAVVNRAMLKVLGLNEKQAVGKTFNTSFIVVGDLLSDSSQKVESVSADYTIVGVTPDERTPIFYVPFMDLRSLGITNFSQVKLVANEQDTLSKIRRQVEAMGFVTRSVADTVAQINALFTTARTVLLLLGMVALAVASLGMFNTLTVSLLERTREVGLMKAMGMKSSEVQELFLTESMIMGFFGGLMGIGLGWVLGKLVGVGLSVFAIIGGVGFIDVSYIPLPFTVLVIFLSLVVGIFTGIYPARRATKISALNALRYE